MAKKFYVVWKGRQPGIYTDWSTCKQQVDQFPAAKFKSYATQEEAETAFREGKSSASGKSADKPKSTRQPVKTYNGDEIFALQVDTKIFTDGGCEPNPGNSGSGVAVYRKNVVVELWYGLFDPHGTNNTAELKALQQAMLMVEGEINRGNSVAIFCDSKYAIQCVTQWAVGWEKNGWTKKSGEIKNLDLIKQMFTLHKRLRDQVQVLHVNGHVGVEGNELADRMSILAMTTRERRFVRYRETIDVPAILATRSG